MRNIQIAEAAERATLADLQATFLFEEFTLEQLQWVIEHSEVRRLAAGEYAVQQDDPTDAFWVLLDGEIRFARSVNGEDIVLEIADRPGSWGGWLPMFDNLPTVSLRAVRASRVLRIPKAAMQTMLERAFPMTKHLLIGVYGGVQAIESTVRQQEKLAALGRLSAGLAHELNNPAAASGRAATQLRSLLADQEKRALYLGRLLEDEEVSWLVDMRQSTIASAAATAPLDPLVQSANEDAMLVWFEQCGIARGWDLAPDLVAAEVGVPELRDMQARLPPFALPAAISWLCSSLSGALLAREILNCAERISELVGAMGDYTYMDQAPIQNVDIHDGLESTLTILGGKFNHYGIEIVREYDRTLPRITAYGSELNQAWTHLIVNAVEALDGEGRIHIRTSSQDETVLVEIVDNGPGIPKELHSRIWEPFFTTKGVGEGTGLGLDIARRVVVRLHGGTIAMTSQPGETCFRVFLPLDAVGRREPDDVLLGEA